MAANGGKRRKGTTARQAKSRALAAKYKHEAAQLKKAGILSPRVNARKNITRSTRTKINKFRGVLEGREIAVPAPKKIREQYTSKGILEERGRFLIAPKQYANQRGRLSRGMVQLTRPLKNGQEEYVILPFNAADMPGLVQRLKTDESLEGLKEPNEFFSFRLEGWNSQSAFVSAEEMGDYIETRYQHLFKPGASSKAVKFFTFQRFKTKDNVLPDGPSPHESHEPQIPYPKKDRKGEDRRGTRYQQQLAKDRARKRKERKRETPEEYAARKNRDRIRSAQYRQRKFEES